MRTIDRLSTTTAFSRIQHEVGRLRRATMRQRPAVRMAVILVPALALAFAAYWTVGTLTTSGPRYLARGREFSAEDLIKICRELNAKNILYRQEDRKIEVDSDQFDQATAAIGRLDLGRHAVSEIREKPFSFSDVVATPEDREHRERLVSEQLIERFIDDLPGVDSSFVSIQRPRARFGDARPAPSAFVYLEGDSDRPLPSRTVRAIAAILQSKEGVGLDAITMMDHNCNSYLDPHDPAAGQQTHEEELRQRIVERLPWIKGVQVWVELGGHDRQAEAAGRSGRESSADRREPGDSSPEIVINGPTMAAGEPAIADRAPAAIEKASGGRVFVYVPRSYYFTRTAPDHRKPSDEELRVAAERTGGQIKKQVHLVVPGSWNVEVDTFADDLSATRTAAALAPGSEHRRIVADWGIVGVVAASVALVMAMGSWIQAARRPSRAVGTFPPGRSYRQDAPDEPGPSERVRELVRRDPEAAASVLQRWATQGGRVS